MEITWEEERIEEKKFPPVKKLSNDPLLTRTEKGKKHIDCLYFKLIISGKFCSFF